MAASSACRGCSCLAHLLHRFSWQTMGMGLPHGLPPGRLAPFGSRTASGQVLRNRMRSVKSIQKITKAMKMVAASKLKRVQTKTENSRGVWQPFVALIGDHPDIDTKKNVILTISSDRGLCGGINSNVVKVSKAIYKITGPEADTRYIVIGEKAKLQLQRDSKKNIHMTSMIIDEILKNVEFDAIRIIFNKFQSVMSFQASIATILSPELLTKDSKGGGRFAQLESYEIESAESKTEVFQNLSEFFFATMFYNACLENACSEQGARMSAMENSTRNATDMLEKLTLKYNRSRQASITTELIEIISGAAALEASG